MDNIEKTLLKYNAIINIVVGLIVFSIGIWISDTQSIVFGAIVAHNGVTILYLIRKIKVKQNKYVCEACGRLSATKDNKICYSCANLINSNEL
jgi:uncharacterized membrane protein YiaA